MRRQRLSCDHARVGSARLLGVLLLVLAFLGCTSGASSMAGAAMAKPSAGHSAAAIMMAAAPDGTSSATEHSCVSGHDRSPASRTEPVPHTPVPGADQDLLTGPPPTAVSPSAASVRERAPGAEDSYALCVIRT